MATLFGAMLIHVAMLNGGDLIILSICGCGGLGLHALTRNARKCYAAAVDLLATLLSTFFVFTVAATQGETWWQSLTIVVGGISVSSYFVISFFEVIAMRTELHDRLAKETQNEKMRALGQLSSGVAHDFNNLLTIIGGNIELAQVDSREEILSFYLNEAMVATNRGAALIRNLLAFARKSKVKVARHEVRSILNRVDTLLSCMLPAHLNLTVIPLDQAGGLDVDKEMLENAILNLAINARDALGNVPGEIIVKAVIEADPQWLVISIEDSGPGIDQSIILDATEPFFTTKQVGKGSGLGLSMVKGFTEQSGGDFEITNRDTGGLRAVIRLPLVQ